MRLPPRWVVAVSVAVAAAILGDSLLYAVLPTIWPRLGLEVGMVGVLLSANRFIRLGSNPLAGWLMARTGPRGPFVIAIFLAAATTAAYALGSGFVVLLLARLVWGLCWSCLRLGGYLAALEAATDRNRGYYLGFFNGVTRFGSFVAVLAGGFLTDLIGFSWTVYLFTGATLLGGLAVLRERPPQPASAGLAGAVVVAGAGARLPTTGSVPPTWSDPAVAPAVDSANVGWEPAGQAGDRRIWIVYLAVFLHGVAVSGLATATLGLWLLTLYGKTSSILSLTVGVATLTGGLLSARFLADFLWGPVSGHLSDRHGRRRLTLVAGAIEVAALVGLAQGGGLGWTIGTAVVLFLAATAFQSALDAQAGDLAPPAKRAKTMSWYATSLDLGAAVGPLIGYLIGAGVGLDLMYRLTAGLLFVVGVLYCGVFARPVARRATPVPAESAPGA